MTRCWGEFVAQIAVMRLAVVCGQQSVSGRPLQCSVVPEREVLQMSLLIPQTISWQLLHQNATLFTLAVQNVLRQHLVFPLSREDSHASSKLRWTDDCKEQEPTMNCRSPSTTYLRQLASKTNYTLVREDKIQDPDRTRRWVETFRPHSTQWIWKETHTAKISSFTEVHSDISFLRKICSFGTLLWPLHTLECLDHRPTNKLATIYTSTPNVARENVLYAVLFQVQWHFCTKLSSTNYITHCCSTNNDPNQKVPFINLAYLHRQGNTNNLIRQNIGTNDKDIDPDFSNANLPWKVPGFNHAAVKTSAANGQKPAKKIYSMSMVQHVLVSSPEDVSAE